MQFLRPKLVRLIGGILKNQVQLELKICSLSLLVVTFYTLQKKKKCLYINTFFLLKKNKKQSLLVYVVSIWGKTVKETREKKRKIELQELACEETD